MNPIWNDQYLLATKLTPPRSFMPLVIPRLHLFHALDAAAHYPFVLLSAPAGSGKTTLLSSWLLHSPRSAAWISLERLDDDLPRFWHYLLLALSRLHSFDTEPLRLLPDDSLDASLTLLLNVLATFPDDCLIVFDNYESVSSSSIHQAMAFLLSYTPPQIHVFMATRTDPPLSLARLRVRSRLVELHEEELRFSLHESSDLLTLSSPLSCSPEQVAALHSLTEGWPAGLQLAALQLQSCSLPATINRFISQFGGSNHLISQYLFEEVLSGLSADLSFFLLSTSLLARMNSSLCEAVTGLRTATALLEGLCSTHCFLLSLDDEASWYRYHPLFAEALQARLRDSYPDLVSTLHLRASYWYAQHSMLAEAVQHALSAQAYAYATMLLETHAFSLFAQGYGSVVWTALHTVQPYISTVDHPLLLSLLAKKYLYTGQLTQFSGITRSLELSCSATSGCSKRQDSVLCSALLYLLRAEAALLAGDGAMTIQAALSALSDFQILQFSPSHALLRSRLQTLLGAGYLCCGDLVLAHATLLTARRLLQYNQSLLPSTGVSLYLADIHSSQGRLHTALDLYCSAILNSEGAFFWDSMLAHCRVASLYYEWNNMTQMTFHLQASLRVKSHFYSAYTSLECSILSARLAWLQGDAHQALTLLELAADEALSQPAHRSYLAQIIALRVHFLLLAGHDSAASALLDSTPTLSHATLFILEYEAYSMAHARFLMAHEDVKMALSLLEDALFLAQKHGRTHSEISLLVLLAQAYHSLRDFRRTQQTLTQALTLGRSGDYCRVFLDEGPLMADLLTDLYYKQQKYALNAVSTNSLAYLHTLLNAFGRSLEPDYFSASQKPRLSSLDQLSGREQDVLRLIAAGHSNQQIALSLVVAESTIKTHLNNIYTKLNVNSRLQALTKAHTFGLLD